MTLSFRFLALTLLAAFAFSIPTTAQAEDKRAFVPIVAAYLVKDPAAKSGYRERIRWVINSADTWDTLIRTVPYLPIDTSPDADPFKSSVDDVVILTRNDLNGLTGVDLYLSSIGIMKIERGAEHAYFYDSNKFWAFLEEEQQEHSSFDLVGEKEVDKKAPGIVAIYNLNQNIPNPNWTINDPTGLQLYQSYLKGLTAYDDLALRSEQRMENFDDLGLFILHLNTSDAPAQIATVTRRSIRLSNPVITTTFYQDTRDQYNVFRRMAIETIAIKDKQNKQEEEAVGKREF